MVFLHLGPLSIPKLRLKAFFIDKPKMAPRWLIYMFQKAGAPRRGPPAGAFWNM